MKKNEDANLWSQVWKGAALTTWQNLNGFMEILETTSRKQMGNLKEMEKLL